MTEIIAVFRSRSQAIDCNQKLRIRGIPAAIISTPQRIGVGCGYSIKFSSAVAGRVKSVILRERYSSFYGYIPYK